MNDLVQIERGDDGITLLNLNRAPVNALNPAFLTAVEEALAALENDADTRSVVIASPFKVLSAGVDLKEAQGFSLAEQTAIVDGLNSAFARLFAFPKPVVTAANGAAIAGGLFFVLAADHAVAAGEARFGLTEVKVGVAFPIGPLEIARAVLPPAALNRMMLGGDIIDTPSALRIGFIDEIVERDAVRGHALNAARRLAQLPPKAYAAIKAQIRAPALALVNAAIADGSDPASGGWFTDETAAAMAAMLARRG